MAENKREFVELGAAWTNTDRQGRKFLSTTLFFAGRRVLILKNTFKRTDKEPDFRVVLAPAPEAEGDANDQALSGNELYDDQALFEASDGTGEPEAPPAPPARAQRPPEQQQRYQARPAAGRVPMQPGVRERGPTRGPVNQYGTEFDQGNVAEAGMGDDLQDPFEEDNGSTAAERAGMTGRQRSNVR